MSTTPHPLTPPPPVTPEPNTTPAPATIPPPNTTLAPTTTPSFGPVTDVPDVPIVPSPEPWAQDRNLGPWPFIEQRNKWGYLNNPRWRPIPRPFVYGGPDDYDGRENEEPQIYKPHEPKYPSGTVKIHHQCGHWHKPSFTTTAPTTPPPGKIILIPLEMTQVQLFPDTIAHTYSTTEKEINPADYEGLTQAYFEIDLEGEAYHAVNQSIYLVDAIGTIYATITSDSDMIGTDNYKRVRVPFTLNPVSTLYYARFQASPAYDSIDTRTIRIVLEGDFTKARLQYELVAGDQSAGGWDGTARLDNLYAYSVSSQSQVYGYGGTTGNNPDWFRLLHIDKSKLGTIDHWTFEQIGSAGDFNGNAKVGKFALFNFNTGLMIPGSELTFNDDDPVRQTIDIPDVNMPDNVDIEMRMLIENPVGYEEVRSHFSAVYVTLSPFNKAEVHWRVGNVIKGGSLSATNDWSARTLFEQSKYPATISAYFESTARETGGAGHMFLYGMSQSDFGHARVSEQPLGAIAEITGVWTDATVPVLAVTDGNLAYIELSIPNATAILEASLFGLDALVPASAELTEVSIKCDGTIFGQAASKSAWIVGPNIVHTLAKGADYPVISGDTYACIADQAWTPALLADGTLVIRVRVNQPNNATPTTFYYDKISMNVAWGEIITGSQLDFGVGRSRQRSADIVGELRDDDRYITHFYLTFGNYVAHHALSFLILEVKET